MVTFTTTTDESKTESWQAKFLKMLPLIERHADAAFRNMRAEQKEGATSEVVANAMCAFRRLYQRGQAHRAFASPLTRYAIAQYWDGRRCGCAQNSRDVCSPKTQRKAGFKTCSLSAIESQRGSWIECLIDNRVSSVPNQAAFRIDFPRWLNSQPNRDRAIAERLSLGDSTAEVAMKFNLSAGRISQLRRKLAESWYEFVNGELSEAANDNHFIDQ